MSRDWADAPFVRVYSSVVNDPKFDGIYTSDRDFSWYVRLLLWAKPHYPTPAPIPRSAPTAALKALEQAGIIAVSGDFYTICGLAKEMADVVDSHRAGGVVRAATATRGPDGTFRAGADAPTIEVADGRADIEAFVEVKRRAPSAGQRRVLDDILSRHDVTGPAWAADIILANRDDPIGAVIAADRAWRDKRKAGAIADEQESAAKRRRGLTDPVQQEIARAMTERYGAEERVEAPA